MYTLNMPNKLLCQDPKLITERHDLMLWQPKTKTIIAFILVIMIIKIILVAMIIKMIMK